MSTQAQEQILSENQATPLSAAVQEASERYSRENPASQALFEAAQSSMPGGNTRTALHFDPFPLYIEKSEGASVTDADGHEYLDVLGEFTAGLFGHSDPTLSQSITAALQDGISNGAPGRAEIELSEIMTSRFPAVEKIRFCNTGTEANLYALTLAKHFTGREKILVFSGAYHGGVFVFGEKDSPMNLTFEWLFGRYNDFDGVRDMIAKHREDLAAVIIEPMMSNGGCIPADVSFLQMLRKECSDAGALLIFDEVVTSRMGAGGMQDRTGVMPDLTTFGKYIGGGFSFGAFGGRTDVLDLMSPQNPDRLPHAGTYNNNVFSMRTGVAAMRDVFTPERAESLFAAGEDLRAQLNQVAGQVTNAVQFTGIGSTINIHFCAGDIKCPEDLEGENPDFKKLFHFHMLSQGIYAARRGQINLSLPMDDTHFARIKRAVVSFFEKYDYLLRDLH